MTDTATRQPVTIEAAAVTIRVIHVADKPMTIAVYEQLPRCDFLMPGDLIVGWINREPKDCHAGSDYYAYGHRHYLAVRQGEPVLVEDFTEDSLRLSLGAVEREIEKSRHEVKQADEALSQARLRLNADGYEWRARQVTDRESALGRARHLLARSEKDRGVLKEWRDHWGPTIATIPQLYIAR